MNVFETLSKIDVSAFTEKKGRFTYLSWADAVNVLLKHYPKAVWTVLRAEDGSPYTNTPAGAFVTVELVIEDIPRTQVHPVLDHNNKSIKEPNAFQINTSIQRALAKAISLHGLGLYIYRGEDLPEAPQQVSPGPINEKHVNGAYVCYKEEIDKEGEPDIGRMQSADARLTNDERIAVMNNFDNDKPVDGTRMYRTMIAEFLRMKEIDGEWVL